MASLDLLSSASGCRSQIPVCGTYGCILPDRHPGLHIFPYPSRRRGQSDEIQAANSLVRCAGQRCSVVGSYASECGSDSEESWEVSQIVTRVNQSDATIVPIEGLSSTRVKRFWSASETGHRRGAWYRGNIRRVSKDGKRVLVVYDDGDEQWENKADVKCI